MAKTSVGWYLTLMKNLGFLVSTIKSKQFQIWFQFHTKWEPGIQFRVQFLIRNGGSFELVLVDNPD
jgi:hypothetical protein